MVLRVLAALRWWVAHRTTWLRRKVARALGTPLLRPKSCYWPPRGYKRGRYPWFWVTAASHYFYILRRRYSEQRVRVSEPTRCKQQLYTLITTRRRDG